MSAWVEVFRHHEMAKVQLTEALLSANGLSPVVYGAHLASMVGIGSHVVPARVMVRAKLADEARTLLAVMESVAEEDLSNRDDPEVCPACGADWEPGFDVCWQCQAEPR